MTRFTQPQSIFLGGKTTESQAHNEPITPKCASPTTTKANAGCTPEPLSAQPLREPSAGAVLFGGELSWEQSSTSVDIYVRLPFSESKAMGAKEARKVTLIKEEPPEDLMGGRSIPAALTAADPGSVKLEESCADEKEKLFPVAWGLEVCWPVDAICPTEIWKLSYAPKIRPAATKELQGEKTTDREEVLLLAKLRGFFPFPVTNVEEAWNWEVLDSCPLTPRKKHVRYLHIELVKKQSLSLAGVCIWWDKLFLGHSAIDTSKRPGAEKRAAFAQVWKEAHDAFKEKMRLKRECDDRIIVTSDGLLIDPHNKGPDDDTAKPEAS